MYHKTELVGFRPGQNYLTSKLSNEVILSIK